MKNNLKINELYFFIKKKIKEQKNMDYTFLVNEIKKWVNSQKTVFYRNNTKKDDLFYKEQKRFFITESVFTNKEEFQEEFLVDFFSKYKINKILIDCGIKNER